MKKQTRRKPSSDDDTMRRIMISAKACEASMLENMRKEPMSSSKDEVIAVLESQTVPT